MTSQFPAAVIAAAQESHALYFPKGPFASVTLAQWAIESAWGKSVSGKNNYFGIKATPAQMAAGQATARWTQEFSGGEYHKVEQWFADYPDETGSFDAHAKLLAMSPIYADAQRATNVRDYVVAMSKRYATAPNYPQIILSLISTYGLEKYDWPKAATAATAVQASPITVPSPTERLEAIKAALATKTATAAHASWLAEGEAWLAKLARLARLI